MIRRLALALAVCVAGAALARAQPGPPTTRRPPAATERPASGYDHIGHEGKVSVAGADPIACAHCHDLRADGRLRGQPDHRACFGSCHGKPPAKRRRRGAPYAVAPELHRICEACHTPAQLARVAKGSREKLAAVYRPYRIEPDYSITFPHDRHRKASAASGGCLACHTTPADKPESVPATPLVHGRCTPCHAQRKAKRAPATTAASAPQIPSMRDCKTCHLPAFGPATSPHLVRGAFPVGLRFSHQSHKPRVFAKSPKDGCSDCHQAIASAQGDELPTPKTPQCAVCHDGSQAFSPVEPACTRCHSAPPERTRRPATPAAVFSHQAHRERGLKLACAACHGSAKGAPPAATGLATTRHAPCSDSGCHASEFVAQRPTICAVCHVGYEPWRPLHRELGAARRSEFGVRFDHKRHASDAASCDRCHRIESQARTTQPPADHAGCSGDACHDRSAKPALRSCGGCHQAGTRAARTKTRTKVSFSTRARFDHRPHARAADGSKLVCSRCHTDVSESRARADIAAPKKSACAGCHDGSAAFKMTGHGCKRCHGKL